MPVRSFAMLATVAVLALAGCGGDASSASLEGPLDYVRSGGIAGDTEKLTLRPDGAGTFELDQGLKLKTKEITIAESERDEIAKLLQDADLGTVDSREGEPKPDAYAYSIAYGGDEVTWQSGDAPQQVEELTGALDKLAGKYRG